jgi:hypothetical protein
LSCPPIILSTCFVLYLLVHFLMNCGCRTKTTFAATPPPPPPSRGGARIPGLPGPRKG